MCKLHEQTSCCFSRKRFDIFCFQGADTLEKIVSFNKQLRQFKKVHERFVLDSKDLGFSEFLVNMRIIVFFSNKLDARVLLMNKNFFRNKLLTEESLREDSMEEENYIPEVQFMMMIIIVMITMMISYQNLVVIATKREICTEIMQCIPSDS